MKDSTFEIKIRFVGEHDEQYPVDEIELYNALLSTISGYGKAGEIKILGGLDGININIQVQPLAGVK